jgi:ComEC/Rec2-related protein
MYLNGITATGFAISSPKVIKSESGYFYDKVQNIRGIVYKELIRILGPDQGNFVSAILIGETKAINKHMADNMRNSGIAHILSVSGLHLSLVAMIFFISSRFLLNCSDYLSYKINIKVAAGIISILGSFGYLLLSGTNIAATRAFIMTFFVIFAIIMERSAYPLRSVMVAGGCILLFSPEYVMHPSFQLSFSAVLCLISGYELYLRNQKLIGRSKGIFASIKLYVFSNLYSSFLGSIVTVPFVIYHFYKFATYSLLMNLLAVPLMSFFMMPLAIISLLLMPFNASYYSLKLLGFFC